LFKNVKFLLLIPEMSLKKEKNDGYGELISPVIGRGRSAPGRKCGVLADIDGL
jgi:hypothetical protein